MTAAAGLGPSMAPQDPGCQWPIHLGSPASLCPSVPDGGTNLKAAGHIGRGDAAERMALKPEEEGGRQRAKRGNPYLNPVGPGQRSPTAFSDLHQIEHYPHGLADANPDVKMFEASWGRKKGMELGISHIRGTKISYTAST